MIALKNILVATDFGEPSEAALLYGRDLSRTFGAALHVLHVVDDLAGRYAPEMFPMNAPALQRDVENAGRERLESVVTGEDLTQLRAKRVVRSSNAPASAIVDYAKEAGVDLIVMGTHGRGAVSHLLLGSVAERVVRMAPCPVLTVRHPEREFIGPDALVKSTKV